MEAVNGCPAWRHRSARQTGAAGGGDQSCVGRHGAFGANAVPEDLGENDNGGEAYRQEESCDRRARMAVTLSAAYTLRTGQIIKGIKIVKAIKQVS